MGVFLTTAVFCIFAYVWLFIVLTVWSKDYIELVEAILTLLFFVLLVILAFAADKYNAYKKKKMEQQEEMDSKKRKTLSQKDFYRIIGVQQKNQKNDPRIKNDEERVPLTGNDKGDNKDVEDFGKTDLNLDSKTETTPTSIKDEKPTKKNDFADMVNEVKRDKDGYLDVYDLANRLKPQPVQERVLYNRGIGATLSGRKPIYNNIQNQRISRKMTEKMNENFGFNTLKYSVQEDKGPLIVKILNKKNKYEKIGIRTFDGTATAGLDYERVNKIIELTSDQDSISIEVGIVADDQVEPDENFFIELYDPATQLKLEGRDTRTEVIIIDTDRPGIITFKERLVKVCENQDFAEVSLIRVNGGDGLVGCKYYSKEKEDEFDKAIMGVDFNPVEGEMWFEHNELEKTILVPIKKKDNDPERDDTFEIRIEKLSGESETKLLERGGVHPKFSKKNFCLIEITANLEFIESVEKVRKILEVEDLTWGGQFRYACMLAPSLTDEGIEEVTCSDALMHFLTIFWKLIFALIPPRRYGGGWPCFIIALIFIGVITAIVGEAATVFGCVIGLKPAITAISFVALGTSLPDTFASRQAALESKTADAAIGNVTGSNSVNVFLGLGLPWMIATAYKKSKYGEDYYYPAGSLAFSVMLYLSTSVTCFIVLIVRRYVSGGELGGMNGCTKWMAGIFCICLWLIYLIMSSLQIVGIVPGI
jgi:solute carrier family 8 (sodium/calcium exchanger)